MSFNTSMQMQVKAQSEMQRFKEIKGLKCEFCEGGQPDYVEYICLEKNCEDKKISNKVCVQCHEVKEKHKHKIKTIIYVINDKRKEWKKIIEDAKQVRSNFELK